MGWALLGALVGLCLFVPAVALIVGGYLFVAAVISLICAWVIFLGTKK